MDYADQLYALQLDIKCRAEALCREIDGGFDKIVAEEARLTVMRNAREADQAREEPVSVCARRISVQSSSQWDDEDSFWEFRNARYKY